MYCETVALLGFASDECRGLDQLVGEFGWSVQYLSGLPQLRRLLSTEEVVAVLINAPALDLSWPEAVDALRTEARQALPVVCHACSEEIDWPALAEAGAFHTLLLPFHLGEVKQSLGFIAAARQRARALAIAVKQVHALERHPATRCDPPRPQYLSHIA